MGWFGRRRELSPEEVRLIEKVEKQLAVLIQEWDGSYKNKDFLLELKYESFIRGLIRYFNHYFSPHIHFAENEPEPGCKSLYFEKKLFKKLWGEMVVLYRRIPVLIRKGNGEDAIKLLLKDIDLFEVRIVRLTKDEAVRWDSRVKALREYIAGKSVEHLSLPVNSYDKKRIVSLYQCDRHDVRASGIAAAEDLVVEAVYVKDNRLRFTNRIIEVCKLMRNDLMSLL